MAAAISAHFYARTPVFVVDPEAAWQFLKRRISDVEGSPISYIPSSGLILNEFPNRLLTTPTKAVESDSVSSLSCPNHGADSVDQRLGALDPKRQLNRIVRL